MWSSTRSTRPLATPRLRVWSLRLRGTCREETRTRHSESSSAADRIVEHIGDSATFDFQGLGKRFDVIYIDGAHSREYVENDTRIAFEMVSETGAIVWDDYDRRTPEVAEGLILDPA